MAPNRKAATRVTKRTRATGGASASLADVQSILDWLKSHSTKHTLNGVARYGIPSDNALGVAVKDIQALGKIVGRNHDLALALWETECYEARMLVSFIGDPDRLTSAQMDRWCRDFDSWAICDTLCFHLFDRSPHAWAKVEQWSKRSSEFQKRAAFALLACLAGHDKDAADERFVAGLVLLEDAASDDRNFIKKGHVWALRRIGGRNAELFDASAEVARRLAASTNAAARWVGKTTLRDLKTRPKAVGSESGSGGRVTKRRGKSI
ncbi:MAG: DNA alkylation repair protein [Bryobacteraceae bacterium]